MLLYPGTGIFARFIHRHSNRKDKEFCAINCGALPENLIESELFGYEKEAFTGANQSKEGLLKRADGGTVFLDEIGEMPFSLQVKLLRVLQEGAMVAVKVDIRVIAATNRNLQEKIQKGLFREDLYYRLNVLNVHVPALRDRHRDVLSLAEYFIKKYAVRFGMNGKKLSAGEGSVFETQLAGKYSSARKFCSESSAEFTGYDDYRTGYRSAG